MNMNMEKPILRHSGSCLAGNDRGSALLMTLGVLLLMMVIGLGFIFSAIVDRDVASAQAEANKAKLTAESAGARGMAIIQKQLDFTTLAADPKLEFSPLLTNLFPTAANKTNGSYQLPTTGELSVLDPTGIYKVGSMAVTVMNRTGKLDPNWFGRPSQDFVALGGDTWNIGSLASIYSNGNSPVMTGFLYDLNCSSLLSATVRNDIFVASPELRKAILSPASSPPWSVFTSLPKDYQTWGSRDQIFSKAGTAWSSQLADYSPSGAKCNLDFLFPASPVPLTTNSDGSVTGGNTFVDWGVDANWRNAALLTGGTLAIKPRVPFAAFAYLNFSQAATGGDVKITGTGITYLDNLNLSVLLPWFKMQYDRRVTDNSDLASYYELAANFKDYVDTDSLPTSNVILNGAGANVVSTTTTTLSFATLPTSGIYCGTEALPAISEIRLTSDTATGIKTAEVEIVDSHYQNGTGMDLLKLAAVVEVEWAATVGGATKYVQKFVTGFSSTSQLMATGQVKASLTTSHKQLCSSFAATTTSMAVSKIRVYLVACPNDNIGLLISSYTAAQLATLISDASKTAMIDVAVLDIPAADQQLQTLGSGGSTEGTVSVNDSNFNKNNGAGSLYKSSVDNQIYVALSNVKGNRNPIDLTKCALVSPVPTLISAGSYKVTGLPATAVGNGKLKAAATVGQPIYVIANATDHSVGSVTGAGGSGSGLISLEVLDPRCNTRWSQKFKGTSYRQWTMGSGSMGKGNAFWWDRTGSSPGQMPDTTTPAYTTEDDAVTAPSPIAADATTVIPSTAYVRNGSPQSLWELGAINRAEPWRTVRLSGGMLAPVAPVKLGDYDMGDWMLLDEVSLYPNNTAGDAPNFTTGYKTENGKANPNADVAGTPGMKQLFMGLGRGANADLANPKTAYESQPAISLLDLSVVVPATFAGVFTSAPIVSRGELATNAYLPTLWNRNTLTTDAAGRTYIGLDRSQEEMIGKVANLLQTRYQYFEIQAIGRSYKGTETQQLTGTHIIRSVVERDAFTGKARTISTEHIDQ
jgi:hypothetical protein